MRSSRPRGVALILVLFVTAVMMILVLEFAHSMQVYATLATNGRTDVQLRAGAQAGLAVAEAMLVQDLFDDIHNVVEADDPSEAWGEPVDPFTLGDVKVSVAMTDESGKFPLQTLVEYQYEDNQIVSSSVNAQRRDQLLVLCEALDLPPELVDKLVDWMDVDDEPEPNGAEAEAYASLGRICRNGPLTDIGELELVLGITHKMVWGDPDDEDVIGLADVCTVTPTEEVVVNANTAPEPVLLALLPYPDAVDRVTFEREREPFIDVADLHDRVPESAAVQEFGTASRVWAVAIHAETTAEVRPLALSVRALVSRTREAPESDEPAGAGDDAAGPDGPLARAFAEAAAGAPEPADATVDAQEDGVIRVLTWQETR